MQAVDPVIEQFRARRLARRNVPPLVMGQAVSLFGDYLAYFSIPWFILELTGRARDLGLTAAAETLPLALFGLSAGVLLDRFDTKRILITAECVRAVAFFLLALGAEGDASPWMVFLAAFVVGTMSTLFDSGLQAFLPSVVGEDLLVPVNSQLSLARTLAWPGGVAVAGILVTQPGGFSIAFAANSYTFVLSALLVWRLRPRYPKVRSDRLAGRSGIWLGVAFLRRDQVLKWATIGAAVANLVFAPLEALLLKFVDEELLADTSAIVDTLVPGAAKVGLFVAAQAVIGSIGIALAPRLSHRLPLGRMYVAGLLALGAGFAVVSTMRSFWAVVPAGIALAGVGWVNVSFFTLRQKLTPPDLLGRVIAASRTLSWILIPLGAAGGGWIGDELGLIPVYLFGSLAVIAVATVMLATPLFSADGTPSLSRFERAIMHASSPKGRD